MFHKSEESLCILLHKDACRIFLKILVKLYEVEGFQILLGFNGVYIEVPHINQDPVCQVLCLYVSFYLAIPLREVKGVHPFAVKYKRMGAGINRDIVRYIPPISTCLLGSNGFPQPKPEDLLQELREENRSNQFPLVSPVSRSIFQIGLDLTLRVAVVIHRIQDGNGSSDDIYLFLSHSFSAFDARNCLQ